MLTVNKEMEGKCKYIESSSESTKTPESQVGRDTSKDKKF